MIKPDQNNDWINKKSDKFEKFIPLIDKENSCVYNDFDAFINGFNDFLAGKLPDLKDNQKTFMKTNDIKRIGKKFIDYYREYFGEWLC